MRPLVVDANVVIAALIRNGATRELLLHRDFDLRSPRWLWDEIEARKAWLLEKTQISEALLSTLLNQIRERILLVPDALIEAHRTQALAAVGADNSKDAPYVAAAMAVEGKLWTHDRRLAGRTPGPTVTTDQLLESGLR